MAPLESPPPLNARRAALLVIDMIHAFANPHGVAAVPDVAAIVPRVAGRLAAWRANGAPVAFLRHALRNVAEFGAMRWFHRRMLEDGHPDTAMVPALAPRAGEAVFRKTTHDGFYGTGLLRWLRRRDVTQVFIVGGLTHLCCDTTARAAFVRGFQVFVDANATADRNRALHEAALLTLEAGVAFIVRSDVQETVKGLGTSLPGALPNEVDSRSECVHVPPQRSGKSI